MTACFEKLASKLNVRCQLLTGIHADYFSMHVCFLSLCSQYKLEQFHGEIESTFPTL